MTSYRAMYLIPQMEYDSYVMRATDKFRQYNNVDVNDGGKVVIRNDDHIKQCDGRNHKNNNNGNNPGSHGHGGNSNSSGDSGTGDDSLGGDPGNPKVSNKNVGTVQKNISVQTNPTQRNEKMNELVGNILNRFKEIDKNKQTKVSNSSIQTDNNIRAPSSTGVEVQTQFNSSQADASNQFNSSQVDASNQTQSSQVDASNQFRSSQVDASNQINPQNTNQSTQVYPQSKSKIIQVSPGQEEKIIQVSPSTNEKTSQTNTTSTVDSGIQTENFQSPTIVQVPVSSVSVDTQTELTNDLVQRIQDILFGPNSRHEPDDTEMNSERISDVTDMFHSQRSQSTDRKSKSKFKDRDSSFHPYKRKQLKNSDSDSKNVKELLDEILIRVQEKIKAGDSQSVVPENNVLPIETVDPSTISLPQEEKVEVTNPSQNEENVEESTKEKEKGKGKGKKSKKALTQPLKKGTWVELKRSPVVTRSRTKEISSKDDINGLQVLSGRIKKQKTKKYNLAKNKNDNKQDVSSTEDKNVTQSSENTQKLENEKKSNNRKRKAISVQLSKTVSKKKSKE